MNPITPAPARSPQVILAAIDFSPASTSVVAEAVKLAQAAPSELVFLHVVPPPVMTDSELGTDLAAEYLASAARSTTQQLAVLYRSLEGKTLPIRTRNRVGHPGQCIVEEAKALGADYIVIGSHGHGAFYDLLVGSTATRVLKQAHCPVVIVKVKALRAARPRRRP